MTVVINLVSLIFVCFNLYIQAQNVVIVVVDGARYSETFGAINPSQYIPHLWNDLKPLGTLYTNFRIATEGQTVTNPGHATIATGTWQIISNAGGEFPHKPTIFEYFRKELGASQYDNYMIAGKSKLEYIKHSDYEGYGNTYGATWSGNDNHNDLSVYNLIVGAMDTDNPRLIIVNFPEVDTKGHLGVWDDYLAAIVNVDDLIYQLWMKIQTDNFYKDNTTLFITNDHGRHDDAHGGF
ncbi:MAG: alkaline phosphatase family protein, partial [Ignavibacteria bacterium]